MRLPTASSLWLAAACPASHVLPWSGEVRPEMERGTVVHRFLEQLPVFKYMLKHVHEKRMVVFAVLYRKRLFKVMEDVRTRLLAHIERGSRERSLQKAQVL
jgi:hypothetical protein